MKHIVHNQKQHIALLLHSVHLSREKMRTGCGGPFGAVIVETKTSQVIAEGWNQVTSTNDPTAHAEIISIREAAKTLGRFHLAGYTIYSSCEPCPMCLSAIYWAHLDGIYYANTRHEAAAIGFDDSLIYREISTPLDQRVKPMHHMQLPEAKEVFSEWNRMIEKTPY
jgi:guanine deaminase